MQRPSGYHVPLPMYIRSACLIYYLVTLPHRRRSHHCHRLCSLRFDLFISFHLQRGALELIFFFVSVEQSLHIVDGNTYKWTQSFARYGNWWIGISAFVFVWITMWNELYVSSIFDSHFRIFRETRRLIWLNWNWKYFLTFLSPHCVPVYINITWNGVFRRKFVFKNQMQCQCAHIEITIAIAELWYSLVSLLIRCMMKNGNHARVWVESSHRFCHSSLLLLQRTACVRWTAVGNDDSTYRPSKYIHIHTDTDRVSVLAGWLTGAHAHTERTTATVSMAVQRRPHLKSQVFGSSSMWCDAIMMFLVQHLTHE